MAIRYVTLADPSGGFYDPQTGFGLVRDEVGLLTRPIGHKTAHKLAMGGIVECVSNEQTSDANCYPDPASPSVPDTDEAIELESTDSTEKLSESPGPPTKPAKDKKLSFWDKKKAPATKKVKSGN